MKKWFFRFFTAGVLSLGFLAVGATALLFWVRPNPNDIALVPMSVDSSEMRAAGFILNSTKAAWIVYIAATNEATADVRISRVWVTTNELQAVRYDTPLMGPDDKATFRILYAKKLEKANTLPSLRPPSSQPLPVQSRP